VDLLVLDEVGIQRGSSGEKVIINQVIDRRLSSMRPVGILTNLNHGELVSTLGERVMDRLQMDGGIWVNFGWLSYRKTSRTCALSNNFRKENYGNRNSSTGKMGRRLTAKWLHVWISSLLKR
jgi:putative replication protein